MGRKSRSKRERRDDPALQALHVGLKAEKRGRRVDPTPAAYARVARDRGTRGVVEGLISRHNQRWENVAAQPSELRECIVETLHIAYPIDVALWRLGVRFDSFPSHPETDWPRHLAWAVDSAAQSIRMTLACNPVGAAAVARTQLERWSLNRVLSNSLARRESETTANFYDRIWCPNAYFPDHLQEELHPAQPMGAVWTELSEVLHGRGTLVAAARWESVDLADPRVGRGDELAALCQSAEQQALQQVVLGVIDASQRAELYDGQMGNLLRTLPPRLPSVQPIRAHPVLVWPLNYEWVRRFGAKLEMARPPYLADVEGLAERGPYRTRTYSERAIDAFAMRRGAAAATARLAFEQEAQQLGDAFAPDSLAAKEFAYTLVNEAAGLLSRWCSGPQSDALAVGASSLRAAYWLWLEDDDRSLVAARTLLEQAARLRVWRLKPDRAKAVEARGSRTSGRDWLEEAGWRRLGIINRSLGAFAHVVERTPENQEAARLALMSLQGDADEDPLSEPAQTVRGGTLVKIAFAFGSEVRALAATDYPVLGTALGEVLPDEDVEAQRTEDWLARCWAFRPTGA